MKPFNREKFLLFMLAGIFIWQAAVFTFGVISCFQNGGQAACPDLGDRYENTVNVMVATTLALLGAGAVASASQKKPLVSDPVSPLPLSPQPQVQGKVQGKGKVQGRVRESLQGHPPGPVDPPYTNQQ